ncbi:MAG TPA: hypothetical protein DC049_07455, partial [Spirochaetia bacterium]|nr:hypothetical protein [Spirochaetia bacterium]
AGKNHYAVAALNTNSANYDMTRAIIEAADAENSPVIIQEYEHNSVYRGFRYFIRQAEYLSETVKIPIALALDHGESVSSVMQAAKAGFTHVMLDNSDFTFDEYIIRIRELIYHLKPMGISIEAEIGAMARQEELQKGTSCTALSDIQKFLKAVEPDLLAVSVGTSHGVHQEQNNINFSLVEELRAGTSVPLVMHGTCGVSLDSISKLVKAGMRKINFGEGLRTGYIRYFNEFSAALEHQGHPWRIMEAVKDKLKEDIRAIIRAINSGSR